MSVSRPTALDEIIRQITETHTLVYPSPEKLVYGLFEAHCLAYELRGLPVVEYSSNLTEEIQWSAYQMLGLCEQHKKEHATFSLDKHYVRILAEGIKQRYNDNSLKRHK